MLQTTAVVHHLLNRRTPHWGVVTRTGLEKTANKDGIDFARMTFTQERPLTPKERASFAPVQRQLAKVLAPIAVSREDYALANEEPALRQSDDDIPF